MKKKTIDLIYDTERTEIRFAQLYFRNKVLLTVPKCKKNR